MTRVVELVINAAQESIAEQELQTALSELYGKPPEHFDKLIHQIFTVKQPYTLLKNIKEEVATKHKARLETIGLECSIEIGLSLMPVGGESATDGSAPAAPECPVCKMPTTSQDECSSCGVDLRKATSARQSSESIQRTLENAEQELAKKKIQKSENLEKQRKEKEEKAAKEKAATDKQPEEKKPVKDVFTAEYADPADEKKRKVLMGGAAAMVAAGVIAFSTGTFTSSPPVDTEAAGELSNPGSDSDADATDATADDESASGKATASDTASDETSASASAVSGAPDASAQPSAAATQNIVAAATAKVEAGSPNAVAADDFEDTIAKFEHAAAMQGDARSAEEVAQDLIANAHKNKASLQQSANLTGAAGGTLQMPSSLNGIGGAGGTTASAGIQQLEGAGSLNLNETLARYSGKTSAAGGLQQGTAAAGSYQDQFLDHWVSRQNKAKKLTDLVTRLMQQGQPEMAQQLVSEAQDTWLAILGNHKIAIAEQMTGDAEGSQDRMMNLFVDLMMVKDLPEKIAALADHAQTWHLMLNITQSDNALGQMKSLAAAPMNAKQTIVANVVIANSMKIMGMPRDSRLYFDTALDAGMQVANQNGARDEMIHFIALAEAKARFGDEALLHVAKIRNDNLRQSAYQRLYQTFSKHGMDREATAALQKAGGADMPKIDRAALEKMLKNGPQLSELEQ